MAEVLSWSSHPLREEPALRSAALVGLIVAVGAIVAWTADSGPVGFAAAGLLVVSTSRYFLPTRYRLDTEGVTVSHAGRVRCMAWSRVNRAVAHRDGVFLSPFPERSRLDTFQGWFIRAPGRVADVVDAIERFQPAIRSQRVI